MNYYVSLHVYDHKVFKNMGQGADKPEHFAFYKPYFEKHGQESLNDRKVNQGPYKVMILPYKGNFVDEQGNPLTLTEASKFLNKKKVDEELVYLKKVPQSTMVS